jgi:phage anti-repressor protein
MIKQLDIVDLIEKNPITRLSSTYQNKMLTKIQTKFTDHEQKMFVASFYCYLNSQDEYVIDLDNIWKWLGFQCKFTAKRLLESQFIVEKDYISLHPNVKQSVHIKGGQNKETFLLKINTFKKYCLKAGTKKADEIHDYYLKLEETLHEVIEEESNELKLQLESKTQQLQQSEEDKIKIREKTLIEQFPKNTQCVYYGIIDDVSNSNEKLIKYGNSNDLNSRKTNHKLTYTNFRLINAFKVDNKLQIENAIKDHKLFSKRHRTVNINGKNYVELISMEGLSFYEIDKTIKEIISNIEFTEENYLKLVNENKTLKKEIEQYRINSLPDNPLVAPPLIKNPNIRNKDGKYIIPRLDQKSGVIQDTEFAKLFGTREEVFNNVAYKTSGGLNKNDLIINVLGKIVSKRKSVQETINDRLFEVNLLRKKQKVN